MSNFEEEQLLRIRRKFSRIEEYNMLVDSYNKLEKEHKINKENLEFLRTDFQESESENKKLRAEVALLTKQLEGKGVVANKKHEEVVHELNRVKEELGEFKRPLIQAAEERQRAELRELLLNHKQKDSYEYKQEEAADLGPHEAWEGHRSRDATTDVRTDL